MRVSALVVLLLLAAVPATPQAPERLSPEVRRAKLAERERLAAKAGRHHRSGEFAEAIETLERVLALERELLGPVHQACCNTLSRIAAQEEFRGDFAAARARIDEILKLVGELHGTDHWRTRDVRRARADLDRRSRMTPEERRQIHESHALTARIVRLWRNHRFREAIPLAEKVIAIRRRLLGDDHPDTAMGYYNLGAQLQELGQTKRAEELYLRALAIRETALGADHPSVASSLNNLGGLHQSMGHHEEAERFHRRALAIRERSLGKNHPSTASSLNNLASVCEDRGRYAEAESLLVRSLEIRRAALGEDHPSYARGANNLARLYGLLGRYEKAEPLLRQALEIRREKLGEEHPETATSLNNLAQICASMGDHERAETLALRSAEIRRKALGEDHPRHAASLSTLVALYRQTGRLREAERLQERVLEITRGAQGDDHPAYAVSLSNLALVYKLQGRYARAEPLYRQALAIRRKTLGERHPDYAESLNNLAALLMALGEYESAEPMLSRALPIQREALGAGHPTVATTLHNLAELHRSGGRHTEAMPLLREALSIRRRALGEDHALVGGDLTQLAHLHRTLGREEEAKPLYRRALEVRRKALDDDHPLVAASLTNLASLLESVGDLDEAEPLYRDALAILERSVGPDHPDHASCMSNLAVLYRSAGRYAEAEEIGRRILRSRRKTLDATFDVLSERQRLRTSRFFRGAIDQYLSILRSSGAPVTPAYEALLAWKGAVFTRQARDRLARDDPACRDRVRELEDVSQRLSTLSFSVPAPELRDAWRHKLRTLTERREEIERSLSRASPAYRVLRASEQLTPAQLQNALPDGVALVDVIEYAWTERVEEDGRRVDRRERHLAAFVVPASGEIAFVELGPLAPIASAIDAWRAGIRRDGAREAGDTLRRLVWEPLAKRLGGVRTVLLSPDGPLNRLPLAALPGKTPGSRLLDEVAVAVIPVPRLLPGLLSRSTAAPGKESLLLVGNVDYGAAPGREDSPGVAMRSAAGSIAGALPTFEPLDATRAEIGAIRDSFEKGHEGGQVTVLGRTEATETAFRKEAGRHRWLHLATHGFFAPPGLRSALADISDTRSGTGEPSVVGYHPGVLSGLALGGANTAPEPDGDDGILTALEVASLDLAAVEVAVLSACETGMGQVAGGEGVLGLQRAFQVAGVRTTVTSLWKVPDEATRLLMQRFYENLWGRGLPKLEALREAQRWLAREGRSRLTGEWKGRGVRVSGDVESAEGPLPPFYWAGFVLSGDWR